MEKIIVKGGKALCGEVRASGSKNASLPLIFASLIIDGEVSLRNVPDIGDVRVALELLSDFGAEISFSEGVLRINSAKVKYLDPNPRLSGKIRASTYLMGASLARFGRAEIPSSGGCNFSYRPIDFHINSAKAFGAVELENHLFAKELRGCKIALPKPSVGATINALLMATSAEGQSEISGFAKEPHVLAVIDFLRAAGAEIQLEGEKIRIRKSHLHFVDFTIIGDMIEAGTYLTAALITGGKIKLTGINPSELFAYLDIIKSLGYNPEILPGGVFLDSGNRCYFASEKPLRSTRNTSEKRKNPGNKISVFAAPYPAFPTDLQPIIAPLLAGEMGGEIVDLVFPDRFGYLGNLAAFGIKSTVESYESGIEDSQKALRQSYAKIEKSQLKSGTAVAPDLRGGMACLLAALGAKGRSEINSPEIILRGYDKLIEKMISLGADIKHLKM